MHPWERRLRDLAHLLNSCGESYFSPDLFRRSTNQFLQTSRTVTFIIQKNKASVPGFDNWYKETVLQPWADDRVMTWAKDARNVVEKEGDLDMQSTLRSSVLSSYLSETDMVLETDRHDLLKANIERLLKLAAKVLPSDVIDTAVLKVQRKWVANSLPDCELIYALTYAYTQIHRVCEALAEHLGLTLDASIPDPTEMDPAVNDVAKVRFLKFGSPRFLKQSRKRINADPNFRPSTELLRLRNEIGAAPPTSLADIVQAQEKMARFAFETNGNILPLLMLYDSDWKVIDCTTPAFSDQADKFLFWRDAADKAFYLKAHALTWVSESWVRERKDRSGQRIRDLPIIGEQLHVIGADAVGAVEMVKWDISRRDPTGSRTLVPVTDQHPSNQPGRMFFIEPVVAAMKMVRANKNSAA